MFCCLVYVLCLVCCFYFKFFFCIQFKYDGDGLWIERLYFKIWQLQRSGIDVFIYEIVVILIGFNGNCEIGFVGLYQNIFFIRKVFCVNNVREGCF